MSYCVNCGVELDPTCGRCPLCDTPVYNPNQPVDTFSPPPFPTQKGTEEPADRKEFTVLMSIVFMTISIVCFILNHFIFAAGNWSLYVIGICALLWISWIPLFFPEKLPAPLWLLLCGIGIALYLAMIAWLHPGKGWYLDIGLPITALATLGTLIFHYFAFERKSSLLLRVGLFLGIITVLCVSIELLIEWHYDVPPVLTWSAIVLACGAALDIVLLTISYLKGVRAELRKRMHF